MKNSGMAFAMYGLALAAWGFGFAASANRAANMPTGDPLPLGYWQQASSSSQLAFDQGGRLMVNGENGRWYSAGTGKLYMELPSGRGVASYSLRASDLQLSGEWTDSRGAKSTFQGTYRKM